MEIIQLAAGRFSTILVAMLVTACGFETAAAQIPNVRSLRDAARAKVEEKIDASELPDRVIDQTGIWAFRTWLKTVDQVHDSDDERLLEEVLQELTSDTALGSRFTEAFGNVGWEIALVRNDAPNAVAFPGGKVGINTGLLEFTGRNRAWLAVALAHEAVHAMARHAKERMNAEVKRELRLAAAHGQLRDEGLSPHATAGIMTAMGIAWEGTEMRPLSREHESEADHDGLLLMARAGFNPATSITFWEEMMRLSEETIPEFLSTHPSYETRIQQLNEWMPEAIALMPYPAR